METQTTEDTGFVGVRRTDFSDHFLCLTAALTAFAVYFITLAPTVTGEDAGELTAAAVTLGIPHPPGYPLWTILAKLFTLIPYAEAAWRASLLSAVLAAATVYVVTLTLLFLTSNRLASLTAALVLAFSREFWEQSVIPEVYTLNAFITALCVYLLLRWSRSYNTRLLYAVSLLFGLGLTNHASLLLLAPAFAIYVAALEPQLIRRPERIAFCALFALAGLLPFLYLPIRSLADPAMDWGSPQTWTAFWDVVLRGQYQHLILDRPRSLALFGGQCLVFARTYAWEFTPWIAWLPLLGLPPLYRLHRSAFYLILTCFLITALAAILLPNFPLEHHWIWMNTTYWIPAYLFAAIVLGVTLDWLMRRDELPRYLLAAAPFVLVLSPFLAHYDHNDRSNDHLARDYAVNLLNTMDENAIYFGAGDHTVFPLVYLQIAEGLRPDITIANQYGYADPKLFANMPPSQQPSAPRPTREDTDRLFTWLLNHSRRPIYTVTPRDPGDRTIQSSGLLYRYARVGETIPVRDHWNEYTWHSLDEHDTHGDWASELILYEYHLAQARMHFEAGNPGLAGVSLIAYARSLVHNDKHALNNLGTLAATHHELELASKFFAQALLDDPNFIPARINLARALLKLNDPGSALPHLERALSLDPENPHARALHKKILRDTKAPQDDTNN